MIVIQARGFTVLRHRDYDRFFKGFFKPINVSFIGLLVLSIGHSYSQ